MGFAAAAAVPVMLAADIDRGGALSLVEAGHCWMKPTDALKRILLISFVAIPVFAPLTDIIRRHNKTGLLWRCRIFQPCLIFASRRRYGLWITASGKIPAGELFIEQEQRTAAKPRLPASHHS